MYFDACKKREGQFKIVDLIRFRDMQKLYMFEPETQPLQNVLNVYFSFVSLSSYIKILQNTLKRWQWTTEDF